MGITVVCPSCGGKMQAPNQLLGRMAKCPQCGQTVKVTASADPQDAPTQRQPLPRHEGGGKRPASPAGQSDEAFVAGGPPPRATGRKNSSLTAEPHREDPCHDGVTRGESPVRSRPDGGTPVPTSRVAYGLGIPALALGIIAFLFSCIPFVGLLSVPLSGLGLLLGMLLSGLGLLLGIAGLVVSITQRGRGIGFPIAASAVSLAALVVGIFWLGRLGSVFKGLDTAAKQDGLNGILAVAGEEGAGQNKDQTNPAAKELSTDREARWVDARGPVQQGDIRVQLGGVSVRNVRLKDVLGDETVSPTKHLAIQVFIGNASKTRKFDFLGWSGASGNAATLTDLLGGAGRPKANLSEALAGPWRYAASLTDNFDNSYKRLSLDPGSQVPGQISTATSIYPGKRVEDLLVFEPPIENLQFLRLELPAAAFGGTGTLRLQIPKTMILR